MLTLKKIVGVFSGIFKARMYNLLTLKICVSIFSGTFEARILKLGVHMDDKLLYSGIENQTACSYSSLYLCILPSFKAKFVLQISLEL